MPAGCASGGPAAETAEKLLHLLALLKLNLVQRKVRIVHRVACWKRGVVGGVGAWNEAFSRAALVAAPAGAAEAEPGAAQGAGQLHVMVTGAAGVGFKPSRLMQVAFRSTHNLLRPCGRIIEAGTRALFAVAPTAQETHNTPCALLASAGAGVRQ